VRTQKYERNTTLFRISNGFNPADDGLKWMRIEQDMLDSHPGAVASMSIAGELGCCAFPKRKVRSIPSAHAVSWHRLFALREN
jgi:hypothetical protein